MRFSKLLLALTPLFTTLSVARPSVALNPLEYSDNGATAFSRGGAWLATATDPIATHYNPAALATQKSGFSVDLNASFQKVCFDRRNPGDAFTGPNQSTNEDTRVVYLPTCNERGRFPKTIPSLSFAYRASRRVGFGFALVPPAAYTDAAGAWSEMRDGYNAQVGKVSIPASYRYMQTNNESIIFMPTVGVGVEVLPGLRVGAGFIWGFGFIDLTKFDTILTNSADRGDHALGDDVKATLKTKDLFMPGAILSAHWSATRHLDLAIWGRWLDAVRTSTADLQIIANYFGTKGPNPIAPEQATRNQFGDKEVEKFQFFAIPPELRAAVRFHLPRSASVARHVEAGELPVRDPLHDDVFDVELEGSYTQNTKANRVQVRFLNANGLATVPFSPAGDLPPNADRVNGYRNSWGARLGGQFNAIQDKLALMAGGWFETQSANDEYLQISPVPALRGGFGGGLIIRQIPLDVVFGYQRHWSDPMDNHGRGAIRANAGGTTDDGKTFQVGQEPKDQQFRTTHTVNGGRLTQSAHVFTVGAVWRFCSPGSESIGRQGLERRRHVR